MVLQSSDIIGKKAKRYDKMDNSLTEALNILRRLSIKGVEAALDKLREIEKIEKNDKSEKQTTDNCPC